MKPVKNKILRQSNKGFTLIEVMFSILIVGLGIAALMLLLGSCTLVNAYGNHLSDGVFLCEQIRSLTDEQTFDNLLNLNGQTFNAVDSSGNPVPGLEAYQQTLQAQAVNPDDFTVYVGPDAEAVVLTTIVTYAGKEINRMSWLRTAR